MVHFVALFIALLSLFGTILVMARQAELTQHVDDLWKSKAQRPLPDPEALQQIPVAKKAINPHAPSGHSFLGHGHHTRKPS